MGRDPSEVTVPVHLDGYRFDKALAELASVSRSMARRLIDTGEAGLNEGPAPAPRHSVATGDVLWFRLPSDDGGPHPEDLPIGVVYEDAHLAVVDKPSGLVTHPGPGNTSGTLVSALLHRWPEIEGVGEWPRWGIVHRLDRETSGLLVVAKTAEAHEALGRSMRARTITREYLALVHGRFGATTGTIDAPIDRVRARRVVDPAGRPAVTHYRREAEWVDPEHSLLLVTLETGRTHQIRVHMESIDRHVVGDRVYGRPAAGGIDPGRVWLHAWRLTFDHPFDASAIEAASPLPPDLEASLRSLGAPAQGTVPVQ